MYRIKEFGCSKFAYCFSYLDAPSRNRSMNVKTQNIRKEIKSKEKKKKELNQMLKDFKK